MPFDFLFSAKVISSIFVFEKINILNKNNTILITGAAGFIASGYARFLNSGGFANLILVDDFSPEEKKINHADIICKAKIAREKLQDFFLQNEKIDFVIHLGARTDTAEMDYAIHEKWNLNYSKMIWQYCTEKNVPLIYASSAATYGNGEFGYDDDEKMIEKLHPLNPYGVSKNEFDKWILKQIENKQSTPPYWYGLKFFNVYGFNEQHKNRMASVIFHAFHQIKKTSKMILFRSHHNDYQDGEQMRDFIYVKDIYKIIFWLMRHTPKNGIYNAGTGKAETFLALANATFAAMNLEPNIDFIDTPMDIRDKYQYYTQANMHKLKNVGYDEGFFTLEEGINDYVKNDLL